jgi:hypothetical protein
VFDFASPRQTIPTLICFTNAITTLFFNKEKMKEAPRVLALGVLI